MVQKLLRDGILWAAVGLLAAALTGCGGSAPPSGGETLAPTGEALVAESAGEVGAEASPEVEEPPATEEGSGAGTASLIFRNDTGLLICALFVIPSDQPDWGLNQLSQPLPSGQEITLHGIPANSYDVKLQDCDGNIIAWVVDIELPDNTAGGVQLNPPSNFLTLVNNSAGPICGVYAVPPNRGPYRRNLLAADQSITPGAQLNISFDPGQWTISVESCDGALIAQTGVTVRGQVTLPVGD
jgi:hypothetical protein